MKELNKIIDQHERIFVLGTGSSLLDIPDEIKSKLMLEFTIGITYSYKIFRSNALIWGDQHFTDHMYETFHNVLPICIMSNDAYDKQKYIDRPDFSKWIDTIRYKFDISEMTGHLTSAWLLQLLKDYKGKIYLLGFDFYGDHKRLGNDL